MNEIKTSKGILKYRMPNIIEVYDILDTAKIFDPNKNLIQIRGEIVKNISPLIDFSELKDVNSYEDLINNPDDFFAPLSDLADVLITKMSELLTKKSLSQTP